MIKSRCRYLLALLALAVAACNNNVKTSTVVILDSAYVASFKSHQVRMKYMSDDGKPNVVQLANDSSKIVIDARRQYIELAFQTNNTITQYFFIRHGDSALLTEWQDNIGIKILNRPVLPFDENYKPPYNATQGGVTGVDDFYRACLLMNSTSSASWGNDAELNEDLLTLKNSALRSLPQENKFIDSLTQHALLSPEVAAFYKLKNTFDSIKINHYQGSKPRHSTNTLLPPFQVFSPDTSSIKSTWIHFTFYDDWLDNYCKQLDPHPSEATADSIDSIIRNLNVPDVVIKNALLQKVRNARSIPSH